MKKFLYTTFAVFFMAATLQAAQDEIIAKVRETISHVEEIPGLKSEEFIALKPQMAKTWDGLVEKGVLEVEGTDKEVRPIFVALQGVVEHVLSTEFKKNVALLVGIIHTPMPATPLCTLGEISKDLVHSSIEQDPLRLSTVKSRATILRDYLHQGAVLYVAYPLDGFAKRTEQQQGIYKQELQNYPNNLIDTPLKCSSMPLDLVGATYFYTDSDSKTYVFAIKMTQAKDPLDLGSFGLYFGSMDNDAIKNRVKNVMEFISSNHTKENKTLSDVASNG